MAGTQEPSLVRVGPPQHFPRTCNVCVKQAATKEVTFGSCQVQLAFCELCAIDSATALMRLL